MIRFPVDRAFYGVMLLCGIGMLLPAASAPEPAEPKKAEPKKAEPAARAAPKVRHNKADPRRTLGEKKLLFIRVDFDDKPGATISDQQVEETMRQVGEFYAANSQGQTRLVTEMTPVLRMPRPAAWYEENNSKATPVSKTVTRDAHEAARAAGYDLKRYNWEIVNCRTLVGRGGVGAIAGKGAFLNGMTGRGDIAHELGHNYGLDHANVWVTSDGSVIGAGQNKAYKNIFDLMGSHGGATALQRHFSAQAKNFLNWLPDEAIETVESSGTYRIFAHDMPNATGLRALTIRCDDTRSYWVEFRQLQETNFYLTNGALIYWGYDKKLRTNSLLDMTPGSKAGVADAPLLIGRTFSDGERGIHITPVGKGRTEPQSLDVVVNIGKFPNNKTPRVQVKPEMSTVSRGQPVTFHADASDADGDTLAYSWETSDGDLGGNIAQVTKTWPRGRYQIRCTVTDMKGGVASDTITVNAM